MSKPEWNEAPEWAEWLAQDEDGSWYWYEIRPTNAPEDAWLAYGGSKIKKAGKSCRNLEWWKTRELRP